MYIYIRLFLLMSRPLINQHCTTHHTRKIKQMDMHGPRSTSDLAWQARAWPGSIDPRQPAVPPTRTLLSMLLPDAASTTIVACLSPCESASEETRLVIEGVGGLAASLAKSAAVSSSASGSAGGSGHGDDAAGSGSSGVVTLVPPAGGSRKGTQGGLAAGSGGSLRNSRSTGNLAAAAAGHHADDPGHAGGGSAAHAGGGSVRTHNGGGGGGGGGSGSSATRAKLSSRLSHELICVGPAGYPRDAASVCRLPFKPWMALADAYLVLRGACDPLVYAQDSQSAANAAGAAGSSSGPGHSSAAGSSSSASSSASSSSSSSSAAAAAGGGSSTASSSGAAAPPRRHSMLLLLSPDPALSKIVAFEVPADASVVFGSRPEAWGGSGSGGGSDAAGSSGAPAAPAHDAKVIRVKLGGVGVRPAALLVTGGSVAHPLGRAASSAGPVNLGPAAAPEAAGGQGKGDEARAGGVGAGGVGADVTLHGAPLAKATPLGTNHRIALGPGVALVFVSADGGSYDPRELAGFGFARLETTRKRLQEVGWRFFFFFFFFFFSILK
jgi:hypothetical protein